MKKKCLKCQKMLPHSSFWKSGGNRIGLRSHCKSCVKSENLLWEKENPEKKRAIWRTMAQRKRLRLDYRIHSNFSRSIRLSINKNFQSTFSVLGYSINDLKRHLEKGFLSGMSWENYGRFGWHIDHIKPKDCFTFKNKTDPQFKECWALNNLQPLWAEDNQAKSNKF